MVKYMSMVRIGKPYCRAIFIYEDGELRPYAPRRKQFRKSRYRKAAKRNLWEGCSK